MREMRIGGGHCFLKCSYCLQELPLMMVVIRQKICNLFKYYVVQEIIMNQPNSRANHA